MATGPERSKALHNFSLPCLKWGTQRLLRCVNADLDRRSPKLAAPQNDVVRVPTKRKNDDAGEEAGVVAAVPAAVANNNAMMPWNLRTRRAACKAPPLLQNEEERRFLDLGCSEKKKVVVVANEKVKFSVSLSKEEVEQDFWALVGTRPPRRPRKRPRIVQRQLNVQVVVGSAKRIKAVARQLTRRSMIVVACKDSDVQVKNRIRMVGMES